MKELLMKMHGLTERDGIWYAKETSEVSFPLEAHELLESVEEISFWFRHRNAVIGKMTGDFGHQGVLLDVGGGRGFVARHLQTIGRDVVLLEPDHRAAKSAKNKGVDHVVCATLEDAQMVSESFGAVGLFDVLEHIEKPLILLEECARILTSEGVLYLTIPAHEWLWSADDAYAGHFRRYTPDTIREQLGNAGFVIDHLTFFFSYLVVPVFLSRTLLSKFNLRGTQQAASVVHHQPSRFASRLVNFLSEAEFKALEAIGTIPFGTSLFVSARKSL